MLLVDWCISSRITQWKVLREKHAVCITAVHIYAARRDAVASVWPPPPYKWSHALCGNLIDAHYDRVETSCLFSQPLYRRKHRDIKMLWLSSHLTSCVTGP